MSRDTSRRDRLLAAATDYVLERGLVTLSLRPLAAALGTSDRMLLYHFGTKDDLVAAVLRDCTDRSAAEVRALAPSHGVREAVLDLWAAMLSPRLDACQRTYVEAAALGLFGQEPYAGVVREANAVWVDAVRGHLVASGLSSAQAARVTTLVDAAFMGFQLDRPLQEPGQHEAVRDLAEAVAALAGTDGGPGRGSSE